MKVDVESFHNLIGNSSACGIVSRDKMGLDAQARLRFGIGNIVQHQVKRAQWGTRPGFADFTEKPMLDGVPLGGAGRVVRDGNGQAQTISQFLLELLFKNPTARGIGAAPIGFDEQVSCTREALG